VKITRTTSVGSAVVTHSIEWDPDEECNPSQDLLDVVLGGAAPEPPSTQDALDLLSDQVAMLNAQVSSNLHTYAPYAHEDGCVDPGCSCGWGWPQKKPGRYLHHLPDQAMGEWASKHLSNLTPGPKPEEPSTVTLPWDELPIPQGEDGTTIRVSVTIDGRTYAVNAFGPAHAYADGLDDAKEALRLRIAVDYPDEGALGPWATKPPAPPLAAPWATKIQDAEIPGDLTEDTVAVPTTPSGDWSDDIPVHRFEPQESTHPQQQEKPWIAQCSCGWSDSKRWAQKRTAHKHWERHVLASRKSEAERLAKGNRAEVLAVVESVDDAGQRETFTPQVIDGLSQDQIDQARYEERH
jgi:hypothetical protein